MSRTLSVAGLGPIRTPRLDLVLLTTDVLARLLGDPTDAPPLPFAAAWLRTAAADVMRVRVDDISAHPAWRPWLLRAMLDRHQVPRAVGHIGFHGPPSTGVVEIGYAVDPQYRRQGLATEAVVAMYAWARAMGVTTGRAAVAPDNGPSRRLLERLSFTMVGRQIDDIDGDEFIYERDLAGLQ